MTEAQSKSDNESRAEIKSHLKERSTWLRLVYMVILAVAWTVAEVVFVAVVVLQFLAKLFTGRPIDRLQDFGRNLAVYMAQIVRFQTFVSEELAFPFTSCPSGSEQRSET